MNDLGYPRRLLNEFCEGQTREAQFSITSDELSAFITASGDHHPLHANQYFAQHRGHANVLLHGMCIAARSSNFLTYEFAGSHGMLVNLSADFRRPVFVDDILFFSGEVVHVEAEARTVEVKWQVAVASGMIVQRGTACTWISEE